MENELERLTDNLKRLYGEYYLIKMTKEEEEKYIRLYSESVNRPYNEVRDFIKKIIKRKKSGYGFAIYNNFRNSLIEKYGEFYFLKMTFEERKILVDYYYRAKKGAGFEINKEEVFQELYQEEENKYQNKIWDYENALERLEFMYGSDKKL